MDRPKLMIPGPVDVTEETLARMGQNVVPHFGAAWVETYNDTVASLKRIFRTGEDLFIMVGSGSAGLDAGVNSLLGKGDRAVLGINGFFGERLEEIARSYGVELIPVRAELGMPVTAEKVEQAVLANPDVKAVIVVHNETSTGVVNPVEAIGNVTRKHNLPLMVDGVTSIGGIEFDMDGWGVDIAVTASQKCLGAPPGLAMIAVSSRAWRIMEQRENPPWGWYLNLLNWRDYRERWKEWHPYPMTMATSNILALRVSLASILGEGIDNTIRRHRAAAKMFRDGIRSIGLKLVADDGFASSTVTAVESWADVPTEKLIGFLESEHGIRIANGIGTMKDRWFRVGHMGPLGTLPERIEPLLKGIEAFAARRAEGEQN